jgi:hypothetical protein
VTAVKIVPDNRRGTIAYVVPDIIRDPRRPPSSPLVTIMCLISNIIDGG